MKEAVNLSPPETANISSDAIPDKKILWASTIALVVSICAIAWTFYPGRTNPDTISMLNQAKTGVFYDWHSTTVSFIWQMLGGGDWLIGATFLSTLTGVTYLLFRLFRHAGLSHLGACMATIATCYTPPVLSILSCVCKDTWVAFLFLWTISVTISFYRSHSGILLALKCGLLTLAILIRPDFAPVMALFLVLEFFFSPKVERLRLKKLLLSFVAIVVSYFTINKLVDHFERTIKIHPESFLYLSDLIDLSVAKNRLLIPSYFLNGSSLETIRSHYQYPDVNLVFYGPKPSLCIQWPVPESEFEKIKVAWLEGLESDPTRYLRHRIATFLLYLWEGSYPTSAGDLLPTHPLADRLGSAYLTGFHHGFLQRHFVTYFGSLGLIFLLIRFCPQVPGINLLIVGLLCSFCYQMVFAAIGFPAYWRFASASVLFFWTCFHLVSWHVGLWFHRRRFRAST